jgi:hypothetical protein
LTPIAREHEQARSSLKAQRGDEFDEGSFDALVEAFKLANEAKEGVLDKFIHEICTAVAA